MSSARFEGGKIDGRCVTYERFYLQVSIRREQACKALQEGGFAGGGRAEQEGHAAGLQDPADAIQDLQPCSFLPPEPHLC